jgi:hypothetical protein
MTASGLAVAAVAVVTAALAWTVPLGGDERGDVAPNASRS